MPVHQKPNTISNDSLLAIDIDSTLVEHGYFGDNNQSELDLEKCIDFKEWVAFFLTAQNKGAKIFFVTNSTEIQENFNRLFMSALKNYGVQSRPHPQSAILLFDGYIKWSNFKNNFEIKANTPTNISLSNFMLVDEPFNNNAMLNFEFKQNDDEIIIKLKLDDQFVEYHCNIDAFNSIYHGKLFGCMLGAFINGIALDDIPNIKLNNSSDVRVIGTPNLTLIDDDYDNLYSYEIANAKTIIANSNVTVKVNCQGIVNKLNDYIQNKEFSTQRLISFLNEFYKSVPESEFAPAQQIFENLIKEKFIINIDSKSQYHPRVNFEINESLDESQLEKFFNELKEVIEGVSKKEFKPVAEVAAQKLGISEQYYKNLVNFELLPLIKLANDFTENYKLSVFSNWNRGRQINLLKSALEKNDPVGALNQAVDRIYHEMFDEDGKRKSNETRYLGESQLEKFILDYRKKLDGLSSNDNNLNEAPISVITPLVSESKSLRKRRPGKK